APPSGGPAFAASGARVFRGHASFPSTRPSGARVLRGGACPSNLRTLGSGSFQDTRPSGDARSSQMRVVATYVPAKARTLPRRTTVTGEHSVRAAAASLSLSTTRRRGLVPAVFRT